jgi:hypothetical protein
MGSRNETTEGKQTTMKRNRLSLPILGWALLTAFSLFAPAEPLGPAFNYQGRLADGANAPTGLYDVQFSLHYTRDGGH